MVFKTRRLGKKRGVLCFITKTFTSSVDDAISKLNEMESKYNTPVRCYEIRTRCRIIGGELKKHV